MNIASRQFKTVATADADEEGLSLPAWIYHDPEFFELEKRVIFRSAWQLVCHVNDIPARGDFHSFEFLGESAIVVRADNGEVRAFHNVCRHRAARILDGPKGNCGRRITCPYHAWTYALDGRLVGVPNRESFRGLDTLATAWRPSSTRSTWDSSSYASSPGFRACARWPLRTRTSWLRIAWRSSCRRDA